MYIANEIIIEVIIFVENHLYKESIFRSDAKYIKLNLTLMDEYYGNNHELIC